jgi:hypothetical protein
MAPFGANEGDEAGLKFASNSRQQLIRLALVYED